MFRQIKGYKKIIQNIKIIKGINTAVIDIVMIHETGIYTFDFINNQEGWIFGGEYDEKWTQTSPDGIYKERFQNPILKYKEYIKLLSNISILLNNIPLYSYVIFNEKSKLFAISLSSQNVKVLNKKRLILNLKDDIKNKTPIFDKHKIKEIYTIISDNKNIEVQA